MKTTLAAEERLQLVISAREIRRWEALAVNMAADSVGLDKDLLAQLLNIHWTWISPTFMLVYRPAFIRDMSTGGPYYSKLLLLTICAHSSRFVHPQLGEILAGRVRGLLSEEIHKPSSIPTTQALLQLSARELAAGRISQAWNYSGIAFRMAADLGLQHALSRTAEESEVRRRLYWGCYCWDKTISLYLGRRPAMTDVVEPPQLRKCFQITTDNSRPDNRGRALVTRRARPWNTLSTRSISSGILFRKLCKTRNDCQ